MKMTHVPSHKSAVGITLIGMCIRDGYVVLEGVSIDLTLCMELLAGGVRTDCDTAVEAAIKLMQAGEIEIPEEDIDDFRKLLADQYDKLVEEIGRPE